MVLIGSSHSPYNTGVSGRGRDTTFLQTHNFKKWPSSQPGSILTPKFGLLLPHHIPSLRFPLNPSNKSNLVK